MNIVGSDFQNIVSFFQSDTKEGQHTINLTPLSYVPGAKIEKYLGSLNFFLIRETSSLREVRNTSPLKLSFDQTKDIRTEKSGKIWVHFPHYQKLVSHAISTE